MNRVSKGSAAVLAALALFAAPTDAAAQRGIGYGSRQHHGWGFPSYYGRWPYGGSYVYSPYYGLRLYGRFDGRRDDDWYYDSYDAYDYGPGDYPWTVRDYYDR